MSPTVTDNNAKCFQATGPPAHSISQLAASLPSAAQNKNCQFKYFPREHAELSPGAGARGAGCDWRPAAHVTTMVASDWLLAGGGQLGGPRLPRHGAAVRAAAGRRAGGGRRPGVRLPRHETCQWNFAKLQSLIINLAHFSEY